MTFGTEKLEWCGYPMVKKTFEDMFTGFDRIHEHNRWADRQFCYNADLITMQNWSWFKNTLL